MDDQTRAILERVSNTRGFSGDIDLDDRRAIVSAGFKKVTLNGARASIGGSGLDFAQVDTLEGPSYGVDYAWQTAARVILAGGAFKS